MDDAPHEWRAPGWGDGVPADKPENFDAMVAAAAEETAALMEQGLQRGDHQVRTAVWLATDAARRAAQ